METVDAPIKMRMMQVDSTEDCSPIIVQVDTTIDIIEDVIELYNEYGTDN